MPSSVTAIIVTYQCGERLDTALKALIPQVGKLVIVDNGSGPATQAALLAAKQKFPALTVIRNPDNRGLAAAQNQGIRIALADGAAWLLLMDDDSLPDRAMVDTLLRAVNDNPAIGIVGPRYIEQRVDAAATYLASTSRFRVSRKHIRTGELALDAASIIASGSMIRREVFEAVGLMNEEYFIDYIDHEFCFRAKRAGFTIALVGDALLQHQQGHKTRHEVAGLEVITANYSAARRYTIARNRVFTARRHGSYYLWLTPYALATLCWDMLRILLLEDGKLGKAAALLRGIRHGMARGVPVAPLR